MLRRVAAGCALAAAVAGCGQASRPASVAQPVSAASPLSDRSNLARPADFARPIAAYRRHVRRELGAMRGDLARLGAAARRGDLRGARAAWLRADARYETIGAAYGAFGALDHAINATPGAAGRLVGLHLVERALWRDADARAALGPAEALDRAVAQLRRRVRRLAIDPVDYALRSHEVLEDSLHLQLSGAASPWSGSALNALAANVDGTRVVLRTVAPMVAQRDPQALAQSRLALRRLEAAIAPLRGRRWDALPSRQRERVSGVTAAAAERLAYVPALISPLPPVPRKPAIAG